MLHCLRMRCLSTLVALACLFCPHSAWAEPSKVGSLQSEHGCEVAYEHYLAAPDADTQLQVLLAHGFQRELSKMRGWAEHWQALGISTTIMSLCNSSWFHGHHDRNADDIVALARALDIDQPVYAGYSAGGLAAYLAAHQDESTFAYLGLDAVDSGELALELSDTLQRPALFITAEPSRCNAKGNFDSIIARYEGSQRVSITGANHCDFEWPVDNRCYYVCGRSSEEQRAAAQAEIRQVASDWLLSIAP